MERLRTIVKELKEHAPFTAIGALTGVILMGILTQVSLTHETHDAIFHSLHPAHVLLSAMVTTAIFRQYSNHTALAIFVGITGSITIGTLSDVIFPYLGGTLLGAEMHLHICAIESPWLVGIPALTGVAISMAYSWTKIPHMGHVLLSTYASLFYLTAHGGTTNWIPLLPLVFAILFIAVWLPCCVSDIAYPLLFVRKKKK